MCELSRVSPHPQLPPLSQTSHLLAITHLLVSEETRLFVSKFWLWGCPIVLQAAAEILGAQGSLVPLGSPPIVVLPAVAYTLSLRGSELLFPKLF